MTHSKDQEPGRPLEPETSPRRSLSEVSFRIGSWRVDPELNRVSRGEEQARLEPRVMALLVHLAEHAGAPITRRDLLETVWWDVVVGDEALTMAVSKLRRALGDPSRSPELVETVAKRGYRLMVPVEPLAEGNEDLLTGSPPPPSHLEQLEGLVETQGTAPGASIQGGSPEARFLDLVDSRRRHFRRRWTLVAAAALSFGWVAQALLTERDPPPSRQPEPVSDQRLTSRPGSESQGEVSPDGTRVAYLRQGRWEPNPGLYILPLEGGTPEPLAEGDMASPVWSPDGSRLAYVQRFAGRHELRLISAGGGSPSTLAPFEACPLAGIDWSPDGRFLATSEPSQDRKTCAIYAIDVESGSRRQLSRPPPGQFDARPTYAPGGTNLAFSRGPSLTSHDLYLMPAEGGTARRITHEMHRIWGFDWAGDGRSLIMASNRRGPFQLWRVPLGGGEPDWIPVTAEQVRFPTVTGTHLVFDEYQIRAEIWRAGLGDDSGPVERLRSNRRDSSPSHSPDGSRLAFVSDRSGGGELWLADSGGQEPRRLTHLEASFLYYPEWSPDGRSLAISGVMGSGDGVFVVDAESGVAHPLEQPWPPGRRDVNPSWSADGRFVYFASNRGEAWNLWRKPVGGGEAVRVVEGGIRGMESPDGSTLYFSRTSEPGLWSRSLAGGPEIAVVDDLERRWNQQWLIRNGSLYFPRSRSDGPVLVRQELESGELEVVFELPKGYLDSGFSVHPIDGSIYFGRFSGIESDLYLISDFR